MIEYIRGNEDDETLQALGIVVIRMLVGNDVSLKQLFLAHGGMNLIMALHQYKEGIVKEQAAHTMFTFRRGQFIHELSFRKQMLLFIVVNALSYTKLVHRRVT